MVFHPYFKWLLLYMKAGVEHQLLNIKDRRQWISFVPDTNSFQSLQTVYTLNMT